ncbi:tyrosine--tRNA ligase [Candidatus Peregrinibacteria bacterium CG10_big_fil_rev_8_21_14_0_10_42_8]|nr:MAG: tyrosine--tRNA ligase [Candidatus Peregrinibacteria bacterium CG10_big_fil_rev_8_21_14_0_10_42_8]
MFELLTKSITNVTPKDLAEKKLKAGKPLKVYLGIDPTGSRLHVGHAVPLRKLQAFAEAGHEVTFLIGSFTAMIGDPTDKDGMREVLTKEQVEENFKTYKDQASKVLDFSKIKIVYNHEWLQKLTFEEVINISSNFTVQQMMERDMFAKREKEGKPISMHEFFYPLMQGYDSVELDVDCEIGGNDQYFNMLAGRTLQKAFGKREKFVLTTKLIEGTDGRKMSKTYNNCIYLDDEPHDMFGKVMRINDDLMETYFECCTDVSEADAKKIIGGEPREAKIQLARELVTLYHNAAAADTAEKYYNEAAAGDVPSDAPEVKAKKGTLLIDFLVEQKLVTSKSEARRLIEQGGIKMGDSVIDSLDAEVAEGEYKIGKRRFVKIAI